MSDQSTAAATLAPENRSGVSLVDCDIHPMPGSVDELDSYLSKESRRHVDRFGSRMFYLGNPKTVNAGVRADAVPVDGETSLDLIRRQVLDEYGVRYGVLNFANFYDRDRPALAADGARAANDWLVDRFLEPEPRLRASMNVAAEHPELAVREIEARDGETWWAQIMLPSLALESLGSRKYWPIYEAAEQRGMPVGLHIGMYGLYHGAGAPTFYVEEYMANALGTRSHLRNMLCEGVFEAFPNLRLLLLEGGVSWAVSLGWALDSAHELFADSAKPERKPSEQLHDNVWFSTQPMEEPDDPNEIAQTLEHGRLTDRLVFSTDYPHWDFDSPTQTLPRSISPETRQRVLAGNACELFGFSA